MILVDRQIDRLASELAVLTGESVKETIRTALRERLQREKIRRGHFGDLETVIREIGEHCASLADVDERTPDEIVGYDENGMW